MDINFLGDSHWKKRIVIGGLEAEVRTYYNRFYGVDLTDDDISQIFNPAREAAGK